MLYGISRFFWMSLPKAFKRLREGGGRSDPAAVARGFVQKIREVRAQSQGVTLTDGTPVVPDGKPRAYILDSLRHPAEVDLLRNLYRNAFVLVGVVSEEEKRIARIFQKYADGGRANALKFMKRDAEGNGAHGQQVAKAFHLSDFFVDNTAQRLLPDGHPNVHWDVTEQISRLIKIMRHISLTRPAISETAMHHVRRRRRRGKNKGRLWTAPAQPPSSRRPRPQGPTTSN